MEPLISVIMSTLNTKEFLEEAIKSIVNQTYKKFEFIIIVDGGNDEQIISNFKDSRIKIIKHKNSVGLAKSLNEAIKISNGKYIARMDSDDISVNDRIEKQMKYMEKYKNIAMTATFYQEFGQSNKTVKEKFRTANEIAAKLFYTNLIAHPSVMFRKSFLDENNLRYDEQYRYSQDFELWTRISKVGKIEIVPEVELNYRIHNGQVSTEKFKKQSELYYSVLKRNLMELNLEEEDLIYLLMLNSRENNINVKELEDFIKRAIDNNQKLNVYDHKAFEIVLKTALESTLIKRRKIFNLTFLKNLKNIYYLVK